MKRGAALLEAVITLGITSLILAGAVLILSRASDLQDQSRRLRAVARLESGLDSALRSGWAFREADEFPADSGRRRIAFAVEFEGVVSLLVLQQNVADPLIAESQHSGPAGLLDGYRPLGKISAIREQAVDAFGVSLVGDLRGEVRKVVIETRDESIDAGIPSVPFDFSWEVTGDPKSERDVAEVTGPLNNELTRNLREFRGFNDLNGNGVLERPLRGPPPPTPLLLTDGQLNLITETAREKALRAWFSERLGRIQPSKNLRELAAMERLAFRRRRLARDLSDPYRQLCWRVEGGSFFADAGAPGGIDPDRMLVRIAAYDDAIARRSGAEARPLKVWEVELKP